MKFFRKKYFFAIFYGIILVLFSIFILLDALVFEKGIATVADIYIYHTMPDPKSVIVEENKYEDNNIKIDITYDKKYDSNFYIADIELKDAMYLKTAFAKNTFGRNILDETQNIAKERNAIFAVNGDYYGFRDFGYCLRNGVVYRNTAREDKDDILILYEDGTVKVDNERSISLEEIVENASKDNPVWQVFSFGPTLVKDYEIVDFYEESIGKGVNPRTAIGIYSPLHYVIVCVDGRSDESKGIKYADLAEYMHDLGCDIAYNLDGGSSTTMWFNGREINKPSPGFERPVSDIVYIGY